MSPQVGFVYLPCYDGGRTALRGRVRAACTAFAHRTGHPPTVVLVPPGTPTAGLPGLPARIVVDAAVRAGELWPGASDPPGPAAPDASSYPTPAFCPPASDPAAPPAPGRPRPVTPSHRHRRRTTP